MVRAPRNRVNFNSHVADPVEWAKLKAARKRGADLIVIDPKRVPAAEIASIWMSPRVGTDAAIALAMMHVSIRENSYDRDFVRNHCLGFEALAERAASFPPEVAASLTGVPAATIVEAARMYANGPSVFVSGHGIDAASNGVQTFRAFHTLAAITGNIDRPGGNLRQRTPKGFSNYLDLLHRPEHRLPREIEERTIGADRFPLWAGPRGWQTACHNPTVIEAMLTGEPHPVRALYASGVNILVTYPDTRRTIEALRGLDFVVVAAHQMTPTAQWADIVLPKTTTLEEEEVSFVPSGPTVVFTRALVAPQGEARPEIAIAAPLLDRLEARGALAERLLPWRSQRDLNVHLLGDSGITIEHLERDGFVQLPDDPVPSSRPFPSPSGKVELYAQVLDELGLDPLPGFVAPERESQPADIRVRYPLTIVTGDREKSYHHSRFHDQP
jgi:thiosulfate reductase/polysulfide reductase chain A